LEALVLEAISTPVGYRDISKVLQKQDDVTTKHVILLKLLCL